MSLSTPSDLIRFAVRAVIALALLVGAIFVVGFVVAFIPVFKRDVDPSDYRTITVEVRKCNSVDPASGVHIEHRAPLYICTFCIFAPGHARADAPIYTDVNGRAEVSIAFRGRIKIRHQGITIATIWDDHLAADVQRIRVTTCVPGRLRGVGRPDYGPERTAGS